MQAGLHSFVLSPGQWVERTNALGIFVKSGRNGGTYAHRDIAFEFGSAISAVFKLYLINEYQRLKEIESNQYNLEWNVKRILSKVNYTIHTDAVQKHIIPISKFTGNNEWIAYAEEADILNMAMFGCTAKDWREANPEHVLANKNIRDFASINELAVLSNLETLNAEMIKGKIEKNTRYIKLKDIAAHQLEVLNGSDILKSIKKLNDNTYVNQQKTLGKE